MKPLCIYHGHCDDGFGAAWAVHQFFGDDVEFYPGVYQKSPPEVSGRDVIMVDFSYKRPVIEAIAKSARSLLILDHHKTAAEDLTGFNPLSPMGIDTIIGPFVPSPGVHVLFDMARSGAGLTWDYFHAGHARPDFIDYVEDRDLWRKSLPGGDEFTIALRSYPQDFAVWDGLVQAGAQSLIAEGKSLQRYYRLRVEELKRSAYLAVIPIPGHRSDAPADISHVSLAIANAPYFAASEVAGEICDMPGATFGACYFEVRAGEWQYSLRSKTQFDVSAVARCFGGGGHAGAAGFTVKGPVHHVVEAEAV
jgi:oligoribonuclease NrnB/cAMP/cGMP phosphodiesterase (DHH superfamily)